MKSLPKHKNFPKRSLQKQRGLTLISWIFVIAILAFCGMFAFSVVPMYAENMYVVKALKSLADPGERVLEMSDSEIRKKIQNFYLINNVRSEGPQNIVIDRKSRNLLITIDYENRTNLFYNIDIVTVFKNHLDGEHPDLCCRPTGDKREVKY
ncbi:hypothetical protein GCM10011613_06070 [Cellvibrio zantedeschiae]|uniref:DUF4845 domain-containing protein n=1 Tax=Cellvibrio zantedeschiae TaxID=1237077 RepID=A0ABQ3ASS0_9GAMM|nr:DUF4845 domain-containing protein [Cellvibrio zantedeschiae]GGY65037.1 hypothetical protein GCM10011613_06070 [Cellvibrio zantedeschiae]